MLNVASAKSLIGSAGGRWHPARALRSLTSRQTPCEKIGREFTAEAAMNQSKSKTPIIDADGHVRETDEEIIEYMSAGYRRRRDAMLYFPLTPHHGWHRSIP